jgi:putative endonuclease
MLFFPGGFDGVRTLTSKRRRLPTWFYILRLKSGKLYAGSTRDREQRYKKHFTGTGCRTTILDPPIAVAYEEEFNTYREAAARERQLKRWPRTKKEALIRGDLSTLHLLVRRRYQQIPHLFLYHPITVASFSQNPQMGKLHHY